MATTNLWDNLNRLIKVTFPDGTFITNSFKWLDLVQVIDRMGFTNSFGYDNVRRKVVETNAIGSVTLYNYCSCGALESVVDGLGNSTSYTYDLAGRLLQTTLPSSANTIYYNYDLMGKTTNIVDSSGSCVTNWYSNSGLLYASSNSAGQLSYLNFDAEDRLTNSVGINHVSVGSTVDFLGRTLFRQYPDGGTESWIYAKNVWGATSYTNQVQNGTHFGYDSANRNTNVVQAGVSTNLFVYDSAGDLLTNVDANVHPTSWAYDSYGRVTNKVDALRETLLTYQYDLDNRLTNRWSATKLNTGYGYDAVGNLLHVNYPVTAPVTLSYDIISRLTNMVDGIGTTAFGYDAVGQLLSEDGPWPNDTVNYTYGNLLRMSVSVQAPNASSWTQTYGYDSTRRLSTTTSPVGTFSYAYDSLKLSRIDRLNLPGGLFITNQYDSVARHTLTKLTNPAGTDYDSYAYTYNPANQRQNVVRTFGDFVNYAYDNAGELTNVSAFSANGLTNRVHETVDYVYDGAGNVITKTNPALPTAQINYRINALNQITNRLVGWPSGGTWTASTIVAGGATPPATNVTVNGLLAALYTDKTFSTNLSVANGVNTFTAVAHDAYGRTATFASSVNVITNNSAYLYDTNGNLLYDGYRGFAYDDENQLISVWLTNVWRNDFAYDGKFRRRIEKDFTWASGNWLQTNEIHFVYDGNLVVQERNTNNLPLVTYTRGIDLSGSRQGGGGIGGLLARTDMGLWIENSIFAHALYHADGNGNATCLIYPNQDIAAKYLYDASGAALAEYGALAEANIYRFSSKEWNANAGLYDYLYRFYDPNLERWLNRDPLGELGGNNLYGFAGNAPLNFIDPFGLTDEDDEDLDTRINIAGHIGAGAADYAYDAATRKRFHQLNCEAIKALKNGAKALAKQAAIQVASEGLGAVIGVGARIGGSLVEDAAEGTETFYRTMSQANYDTLVATGKLPATSETFISPSLEYAQQYNGVTVQLNAQAGTQNALMGMGVRNSAAGFAGTAYEGLPSVSGGWTSSSAFFKWEGGTVNIGLGNGSALNTFNNNLVNFSLVPKP